MKRENSRERNSRSEEKKLKDSETSFMEQVRKDGLELDRIIKERDSEIRELAKKIFGRIKRKR